MDVTVNDSDVAENFIHYAFTHDFDILFGVFSGPFTNAIYGFFGDLNPDQLR